MMVNWCRQCYGAKVIGWLWWKYPCSHCKGTGREPPGPRPEPPPAPPKKVRLA